MSSGSKKKKPFSFEEWSNEHHGRSEEQKKEDERKWEAYLAQKSAAATEARAKKSGTTSNYSSSKREWLDKTIEDAHTKVFGKAEPDTTVHVSSTGITHGGGGEKFGEKGGNRNSWFKSGGFSDGVDGVGDFFVDLGQTIAGSVGDVGVNLVQGIGNMAEGIIDLGTYGVAGVGDLLGFDEFAEDTRNVAKYRAVDEWTEGTERFVDQYSVFGDKTDSVAEGLGSVGFTILTGGAAAAAGASVAGTTAATTSSIFASGMGHGMTEAYEMGADDGEAVLYGAWQGANDAIPELLFGGMGKGFKALGFSKGLSSIDDMAAKKISNIAANFITSPKGQKIVGNTLEYAVKSGAEGVEEVITGFGSALAKDIVLFNGENEKAFSEILEDENLLEQFVVGSIVSSISQSPDLVKSTANGRDFVSGLSTSEQAVVDKVYENAIAAAEKGGAKLTSKQKNELYEDVIDQMNKGQLDIDTIEKTLGGKDYEEYKSRTEKEEELTSKKSDIESEISELVKTPESQFTIEQRERLTSLRENLKSLESDIKGLDTEGAKKNLSDNVFNIAKNTRLGNSYAERARRGQAFEADLSQYKDEKQRAAVQRAIDSGVLNNTYRAHQLVDTLSKMEAKSGIPIDYVNDAMIKELGFAIEGAKVNAWVDKKTGSIKMNVNSHKAWRSAVGHEITHLLEVNNLSEDFRTALYAIAQSKGELESRRASLTKLYAKVKDADIESELMADLAGDYLFTNQDFINKLTGNQTLFKKIWDEVKYLCKVATGKELTEIEKAERMFAQAWKEYGGKKGAATQTTPSETVQTQTPSKVAQPEAIQTPSEATQTDAPLLNDQFLERLGNDGFFENTDAQAPVSDSEGRQLSSGQQEYFKDSEARDENGNLLTAYHSTPSDIFYEYDPSRHESTTGMSEWGKGFYFSNKENAEAWRAVTGGKNTLKCYLNIKTPFRVGDGIKVPQNLKDYITATDAYKTSEDYKKANLGDDAWNWYRFLKNNTEDANTVLKELGYDGIIVSNGQEIVVFDSNQAKFTDNKNPTSNPDMRYSLSSIANTFYGDPDMTSVAFEESDYKQTEGYKNYVSECLNNMRQTRADFDEAAARREIEEQIDGIVRVAKASAAAGYNIYDDPSKRDKADSKKRLLFSSLEPNSDYFTSNDISTICDKRKNFAEIYDDIVRAEEAKGVPKGKRFFDNVDNYFYLHNIMAKKGLTQPCRMCYVESMRKNLAPMANAFLKLVNETDVNNKANDQLYRPSGKNKGQLKTSNAALRERVLEVLEENPEYGLTVGDLTVEMLTTEDGLAQLKIQAPLIYEAFNSFYGQSKPKMPKSATPFRFGELTALLTDHNGNIKWSLVDKINSTGGFRLQSYSDFQIQNFTDVLQVIYEAGTLGLNGHAYTKVPAFLEATDGTNLKRNISIFMYKDGNDWKIDRNDSFPYALEEIYDIVNSDASGNTSIIAVSQNKEMSAWIMANDYIGQGIPFHKSGMKMGTVRDTDVKTEDGRIVKGYSGTIDHTKQQTEVWAKANEDHKALTKVKKGIDIYSFWDFDNVENLSKNELIAKNLKRYIDECEAAGYLPKFRDYVMNNDAVLNDVLSFAKKLGFASQDATIDDISFEYKGYRIPYGYYKFLGDFGMFKPDGTASPHDTLSLNNYDFDKAEKFFADAESLRRNEILQQFANGEERRKYRDSDLSAEELAKIVDQKRKSVVDEVVGEQPNDIAPMYSLSNEGDAEYMSAVERGDTETAQAMVYEAAKATGYSTKAYHGTNADFFVFDKDRVGKGTDQYGAGFYFASDKEASTHYGNRVIDSVLKMENPFEISSTNLLDAEITFTDEQAYEIVKRHPMIYDPEESPLGDYYDSYWENGVEDWMIEDLAMQYTDLGLLDSDLFRHYPNELHEAVRDVTGHDGVVVNLPNGEKFYVAWFDNQMKSADPVTYDDKGNVIPLSERFNEKKDDIRYSLSREGEEFAPMGNFSTPLYETALEEDIAPVAPAADTNVGHTEAATTSEAPILANIPVLPDDQLDDGTYEAIAPSRQESAPNSTNNSGKPGIDKVLTEKSKTEKKKKPSIISKAISKLIDKGAAVEKLSIKTKNRALQDTYTAIRRADAKAQYFMEHGKGGVKSLDAIRKEVDKTGLTKDFYNYLYHKHNIDRMSLESKERPNLERLTAEMARLKLLNLEENQLYAIANEKATDPKRAELVKTVRDYLKSKSVKNKPVFDYGMTAEMSRGVVSEYEAEHPEFKEFAQDVYGYMNHLRQMMVYEGIITQETADLWANMYPSYVPIKRAGHDEFTNVLSDESKTVVSPPIKRATGGDSEIEPLFNTMAERTAQTFKAIAKNRFGIELMNTLGGVQDGGSASLNEVINNLDGQTDIVQASKDGGNPTFTVFEGGKRRTFEITEELYDAMKPASEAEMYTNKALNGASNLHRGVLTEYNPAFALTNAIKDTQDVLINSKHPARTYANYPVAIKELITKGKWYTEYMENGGGDITYFDKQAGDFNKEKSTVRKIIGFPIDKIGDANNFIEKIPRLAEYIASRKKGASVDAAMLDASRVTTDFSAGGDWTKFLNRNGATFLNASVQGFAQNVRNVREAKMNGLKGWLGLATKCAIAGLPAALLNGLLWDDDEEYEELSEYVKENYYVVGKYGDGKFVRIPKGRTAAVIQNAFEQIGNALTGDDEADFGRFFELFLSNLAPNNPLDNNIIAPIMQVAANKTWYGEDLVPTRLQDVPAAEQYDESTDAISKWLGENINVSPYKINYLLNQYSGGVGDMLLPMMTPEAERGDDSLLGNFTAPLMDKFTTDSVMNNQNVSDFYDTVDELTVSANSSYATDEDILKSKYMNSVNSELGQLYKKKREIQNGTLPDAKKYAAVRSIQEQINTLARNALDSYENVLVDNGYATVGDRHYKVNKDGEWEKITDKQLEKQDGVTSELGVSASEYWSNKEEYDYAYESPGKYQVAQMVGGYDSYKKYDAVIDDFDAKDANGKTVNGLKKERIEAYIMSLDLDMGQKAILFKSYFPKDKEYTQYAVDYIVNSDLSYDEQIMLLEQIGFVVAADGTIRYAN